MRLARGIGLLSFLATVALGIPMTASADHCGGAATISRSWGPPGTTFVFRTNLGASSDLSLYQDGRLVRTVYLPGNGFVRYAIRTSEADRGRWRARAEVRGHPECAAQASFTVSGAPETDAAAALGQVDGGSPSSPVLLVGAALTSFWIALRRLGRQGRGQGRFVVRLMEAALAGLGVELLPADPAGAGSPRPDEIPATDLSATPEDAPLFLLLRIRVGSRRRRDRAAEDR